MPRYIDAEFAEKEITSLVAEYENRMPEWSPDDMLTSGKDAAMKYGYKADGAEKALEIVNKIPTADVQEVRHGRWIRGKSKSAFPAKPPAIWYCSCCGEIIRYADVLRTYQKSKKPVNEVNPRCRKCGAKMDGGANG